MTAAKLRSLQVTLWIPGKIHSLRCKITMLLGFSGGLLKFDGQSLEDHHV